MSLPHDPLGGYPEIIGILFTDFPMAAPPSSTQ